MLNLYQMMDPAFMAHLKPSAGQLFLRKIKDTELVMTCGILTDPNIGDEIIVKADIQFDTFVMKEVSEKTRGSNIGQVLKKPLWGIQE